MSSLQEFIKCQKNFFHFLEYCYLVEPPSPTGEYKGGVIRFQLWPHLLKLGKLYTTERIIFIAKARHVGVSWFTAAYLLWLIMFHKGAAALVFSIGEGEAIEFIHKCRRIFWYLPDWLKPELAKDNELEFSFKGVMSSIKGFSGEEYKGTSFNASVVVNDEMDYQQAATENWNATRPVISRGGQSINISTLNKLRADSVFKAQCRYALSGDHSPNKLYFIPYNVIPGRDEEWYMKERNTVMPEQLGNLSRDLYMTQNFPQTLDEAMSPAQTIAAINPDIIAVLKEGIAKPIRKSGVINYYQNYHAGDKYVCGTDVAAGIGIDYSASVILDITTGRVVADIVRNDLKPEDLAVETIRMRKEYENPLWNIEANEWGRQTISAALLAEAENLYCRDRKNKLYGVEVKCFNRTTIWNQICIAIDDGMVSTPNHEGVQQLEFLIRNPRKEGRIEAPKNGHDDYPAALAMAWCIRDKVLRQRRTETFNYVTGGRYEPTDN